MSEEVKNFDSKLLSVESIFKWKPVIYEENMNEISCEFEPQSENHFNFYNFIILLVKSYQAGITDNIDSALKTLYDLEVSAKDYTDDFFEKIQFAYYHMVYASKSFLLISKENYQEATITINKIVPIDSMDKSNKAAIHAMKSVVFALYSNEDTQRAFSSIDKSLKLDPENGHWNFFKALIIRKIRKMTNPFEVPTLQEKELFQKAFDYDPQNVVYKLHLAEVYREIAGHAFKRQENCSHFLPKDSTLTKNLRDNIDEKIHKAEEYFKQAAEEYPDCPYVMFRSAEGLARLYPQFDNIKLATKLTKDGLKKSPENINGNLIMAFLLEYIEKKHKEAEKHLKKCQAKKIFDADMNMVRFLHFTKSPTFKGFDALEILLKKYEEKKRHAILYCQMVSYFMFVEYDIVKATEKTLKFYELNTGSSCMQIHRSCFIGTNEPFSLIDVLNDEVKFVLNNGKTSKEIRESCEKYIQRINFQNVKVIQGFPQNFRQQILQGKPMIINQNCVQPSKKIDQFNKGAKKRETNGGRGDHRRGKSTNNLSNVSNKRNPDNRRQNNEQPVKPGTDASKLPSLMDTIVCNPTKEPEKIPEPNKPTTVIENVEPCSEESDTKPISKDDEHLAKSILKMVLDRRQSENKTQSYDSDTDLVNDILKQLELDDKKKSRNKKYHSDSETDSGHRRGKDRRRERSRRRRSPDSYSDSDDSSQYDRRFEQRHRYSNTDSDRSRSTRHRKSHKKDRYERDYSPPSDSRSRRNRKHSSDDDCGFNLKSSHYRDNSTSLERRRRGRKKSVSRSPSYDRRSRRKSSRNLKSKSSSKRFEREYSPYEKKSRRSATREKSYDRSSSHKKKSRRRSASREKSYDRNSSYEKKSRRRSTSKDVSKDDRGKRATKSRSHHGPKEENGNSRTKRDQNSTASQSESE